MRSAAFCSTFKGSVILNKVFIDFVLIYLFQPDLGNYDAYHQKFLLLHFPRPPPASRRYYRQHSTIKTQYGASRYAYILFLIDFEAVA